MCLNKEVALDDVIEILKEKLDSGGSVTFTPNGTSMEPMLRDGKDIVVLQKPKGRLHLFDVALYRRDSGIYVLHRVLDFDKEGGYTMCGDNQFVREKGIRDDQIIAVLTAFHRKGKPYTVYSVRYRCYVNFWYYTRIPRHYYQASKSRFMKLFGITPKKKKKKEDYEYEYEYE